MRPSSIFRGVRAGIANSFEGPIFMKSLDGVNARFETLATVDFGMALSTLRRVEGRLDAYMQHNGARGVGRYEKMLNGTYDTLDIAMMSTVSEKNM